MKIYFNLVTLMFLIYSCSFQNYERCIIEPDSVKLVTIKNGFDNLPFELTEQEKNSLIKELNNSSKNGPTKYMKKYWIEFRLKNDSTLLIGCNGSIFSKISTESYKTENNYFDTFWKSIDGDKKSWKLYKPIEFKDGKLIQYGNQKFDRKQLENLEKVLDYYGVKSKIQNNKIYFKGTIDKKLNWNYMTKSNDEKWLKEH